MIDRERIALADQLRACWDEEIAAAGFVAVDRPPFGVGGAFTWDLPIAPGWHFTEAMGPELLLRMAEERAHAGEAAARTPHAVASLRRIVQRLARLQAIDWRKEMDQRWATLPTHEREQLREKLWAPVARRALPPRLD